MITDKINVQNKLMNYNHRQDISFDIKDSMQLFPRLFLSSKNKTGY